MLDWKCEGAQNRIMVALDCDKETAIEKAKELNGHAKWLKVGMTLFYAEGPSFVGELKDMGYKIFVDLKLLDIPHQAKNAAVELMRCGADIITVHASGGQEMLTQTMASVKDNRSLYLDRFDEVASTQVIAVSVLTSFNDDALDQIGVNRSVDDQVVKLAYLANSCRLDGMVCSAFEVPRIRKIMGDDALIVTPGIRPAGSDVQDQKRVATPRFAFEQGASHIVIGRPIMQAKDSVAAFEDIVVSLQD